MGKTSYAIALGSNRRHGRYGAPAQVLAAAVEALELAGLEVTARSTVRGTPAMGAAGRAFANSAVLVSSHLRPSDLLAKLKSIERAFGRRRGKRWGARVLDLDILLCAGEAKADGGGLSQGRKLGSRLRGSTGVIIPHPGLTTRNFVLRPLVEIAPGWRHPRSGFTVRHLRARLRRAKPVDRSRPRP